MKKNYFLLAASTMMFAACAQTDMVNEVVTEEAPQAIGFETFANKQTRAAENNATSSYSWSLSDHHTSFMVWGYKNVTNAKVFDGVTVSYIDTNSDSKADDWDYVSNSVSPVYWDKTATRYDFYAAAPAKASFWTLNDNATSNDNTDDYITTALFTLPSHNQATYQASPTGATEVINDNGVEDLMIAEQKIVNKNVGKVYGQVGLNFIHILSRLNVTVKATIDGVKVKNIIVGNLNSQGYFNEDPILGKDSEGNDVKLTTTDITNGTNQRWETVEKNVSDPTAVIPAPVVSYQNDTDQELTKNNSYLAIEALVIPQIAGVESIDLNATTFTGKEEPYLYIEYSINGEDFAQAYNLADAFSLETTTPAFKFSEGYQNTLNISIGGNMIDFTGNVATWGNAVEGTQPIQ